MQRRLFSKFGKLSYYKEQLKELRSITEPELKEIAQLEIDELVEKRDYYINECFNKELPKSFLMEIRAGAGGDESALFVKELSEMYHVFFNNLNWKYDTMEELKSGRGLRQATYRLNGAYYRYLKHESGVHRVQRIPSTDTKGRIHTSTISIAVLPEQDTADTTLKEEDLEIQTYRASGKGGQHVNRTESAVRVIHKPTGFVSANQDERSQHQNKSQAMKSLQFKVHQYFTKLAYDSVIEDRKDQIGSSSRNERKRTFNYPQNRITDHRIQCSIPLNELKPGLLSSGISYSNPVVPHHFGDLIYELTRQHELSEIKALL
eukprot:NODE_247_length_12991_cov_0.678328.p4 type:complete len:319 gc:universal NODE_247_length_12991_cov_0.678328:10217-9261(-)